ncbi:DUF2070 family protein [Candidatus Micrarchaeota archaeon]|nr:DUF2070 family protein [Candidatus Micrarchaeota archaeon]
MTSNINKAVNLTSYFISLPTWQYIVAVMLLIAVVFGLIFDLEKNLTFKAPIKEITDALVLLFLPAILSSLIIKLMVGSMPYRRIAATALGGELVYAIAYALTLLLVGSDPFLAQIVLLIGSALVFVLWYVIARFVFVLKYRSILFAIIQLLFYLVFLVGSSAIYAPAGPFLAIAAKFYFSSLILLGALVLFFFIINAPMKKNLGLKSTDAISYLSAQWLYHNKDMEKAFVQVGERAKTIVSIMGFKRKKDSVFFITPYVHFGPFGNLGGSEFSSLIAREVDNKYKSKTFVFHGTVTHDLNPVSSSELSKITSAIDRMLKKADYAKAKAALCLGKYEECMSQTLLINDSALVSLSRAPNLTEDINFGVGLSIINEAEKFVKRAMVVDQHNSETGEITSFEPGSVVGYNYLSATTDSLANSNKKKSKFAQLKIGASFVDPGALGSIGGAGIKIAVFSTEPMYVMVVIDCNGITPQFKESLEKEIKNQAKGIGKNPKAGETGIENGMETGMGSGMETRAGSGIEVGIFTTDTHQTNVVRGVLNPLKAEDEILGKIKDGFSKALADMQEAEFFSDKLWIDIDVIGAKQSIEVVSTINSIVAVAKITLPLIFIGAVLLVFAIASRFWH